MKVDSWQNPKLQDKHYEISGPINIEMDNDDVDPLLGKLYAEYIQDTLNAYCPRIEIVNWYDLDSKEFRVNINSGHYKLKENDEAVIKIVVSYFPPFHNASDFYYMAQWFYKNNLILYSSDSIEENAIFNLKIQFIEYLDQLLGSTDGALGSKQKEIKQYLSEIIDIIKPGTFTQI
jgi:hypothetical protein